MPWGNVVSTVAGWLDRSEPRVLLSILLIVVGVWAFAALADEVMEGDTHAFDQQILAALRRPDDPRTPIGPHWLQSVVQDLTALGGVTVLTLMTFAVAGFLWLNGKRRLMGVLLVAILSGLILSVILKHSFDRPRPESALQKINLFGPSFPSGHSMMSAVVYLTLGSIIDTVVWQRRLKLYVLGVALLVSGLVGLSRIYLGEHYPTDVLAGWTAGLVWALLWWLVVRWLQRYRTVESAPVDAPPVDEPTANAPTTLVPPSQL